MKQITVLTAAIFIAGTIAADASAYSSAASGPKKYEENIGAQIVLNWRGERQSRNIEDRTKGYKSDRSGNPSSNYGERSGRGAGRGKGGRGGGGW